MPQLPDVDKLFERAKGNVRGQMNVRVAPGICNRDGRFGSKVGQIGPKWDKSGAFSDQISVQNALKSDLKKLRIGPIWGPI